jgi:hypothetical protein
VGNAAGGSSPSPSHPNLFLAGTVCFLNQKWLERVGRRVTWAGKGGGRRQRSGREHWVPRKRRREKQSKRRIDTAPVGARPPT